MATASFKSIHPLFTARKPLWKLMSDCYEGEHAVKEAGDTYLPALESMLLDGYPTANRKGTLRYETLKTNAVFPDFVEHAVNAAISRMHRKPIQELALPSQIESLEDRISSLDESIQSFLRRINVEQLKNGRLGLLGEVETRTEGPAQPVVNLYNALAIINWDDTSESRNTTGARLVILDESRYILSENYTWDYKYRYRVLAMCEDTSGELKPSPNGTIYAVAILKDGNHDIMGATYTAPNNLGTTLTEIPFVFINSLDIAAEPDTPPLLGVANLSMTIYRGEAAYRNTLYMQGENTLVKIGEHHGDDGKETRVGSGASISVPIGGDAKFIGISGDGLSEQRTALENDYKRAGERSGKLSESIGDRASGEALRIRVEAQNVTLPQIALTGAEGLSQVLRLICPWFNADPEKILLTPNTDFANSIIDGKTLLDIVNARGLGAPISKQSMHKWASEQGLTTLSYEEEMQIIAQEDADVLANTPDMAMLPSGTVNRNENS